MSVYDEMRAILALGLKPNELKVLMTYRLEMDETTRIVRGKTQEQLAAVAGLGRCQFSTGTSALEKLGLIKLEKLPNRPALIVVLDFVIERPDVGNSDVQVSECSKSEHPEIRTSGVPKSEHPLNTAPVSTAPIGVRRASSARFWANATGHGSHAYDGGVKLDGEAIVLVNGTRATWLERFGGDEEALALALIQVAALVQPNSSRPLCAQVEGQLARIAGQRRDQDRRYEASKATKTSQPAAAKPKPGGVYEAFQKRKQAAGVAA